VIWVTVLIGLMAKKRGGGAGSAGGRRGNRGRGSPNDSEEEIDDGNLNTSCVGAEFHDDDGQQVEVESDVSDVIEALSEKSAGIRLDNLKLISNFELEQLDECASSVWQNIAKGSLRRADAGSEEIEVACALMSLLVTNSTSQLDEADVWNAVRAAVSRARVDSCCSYLAALSILLGEQSHDPHRIYSVMRDLQRVITTSIPEGALSHSLHEHDYIDEDLDLAAFSDLNLGTDGESVDESDRQENAATNLDALQAIVVAWGSLSSLVPAQELALLCLLPRASKAPGIAAQILYIARGEDLILAGQAGTVEPSSSLRGAALDVLSLLQDAGNGLEELPPLVIEDLPDGLEGTGADDDSEAGSLLSEGTRERRMARKAAARRVEAEERHERARNERDWLIERASALASAFEEVSNDIANEASQGGKRVARKQRSARQELLEMTGDGAAAEIELPGSRQKLTIESAIDRVRWRVFECSLGIHQLRIMLELSESLRNVFDLGPPVVDNAKSVAQSSQARSTSSRKHAKRSKGRPNK